MKRFYEVKTIELGETGIKDFDFKSRTVTGYFSRFGNVDHDGDMLMPGAFEKSIKERGAEGKNLIAHLADHTMNTDNLLAKPKLYEVADGGFFESTITDTTKGTDILKQYRDGLINQHSFGFKTLRKEEKAGYVAIKEVLLYEISSVPLGANDNTPFSGFKSMGKPELIDRYKLLQKCYRDGDYSDDLFPILDAQIKQVEQELLGLLIKEQDTETTAPIVETITQPEVNVRDWKSVTRLLD
jgi:HK97 family phage prohead protease